MLLSFKKYIDNIYGIIKKTIVAIINKGKKKMLKKELKNIKRIEMIYISFFYNLKKKKDKKLKIFCQEVGVC